MKLNRFGTFSLGVLTASMSIGVVSIVNASSDSVIKACVNKRSGAVRIVPNGRCETTESRLSWNVAGRIGTTGLQGTRGERGEQGPPGPIGATGNSGPIGPPGSTGLVGPQGIPGPTGVTGPQGLMGPAGPQGTAGPAGPIGPSGPQGETGPQGPAGASYSPIVYSIGDTGPAGGKIFITPATIGNTTGMYFEAAPNTWNGGSSDPSSSWCNSIGNITSYASYIGKGSIETAQIITSCTTSAADLVDTFQVERGGLTFADWYLPSLAELRLLYDNRTQVSALSTGNYWSTTAESSSGGIKSWVISMSTGSQSGLDQQSNALVRPVRSFR